MEQTGLDEWVLPPEERLADTLEYEVPVEILLADGSTLELKTQKIKTVTKLPWRVRLRERRRQREQDNLQFQLQKLQQEYLEEQLLWGTDLRRDAVAPASYSRFPPKLSRRRIVVGWNKEPSLRLGFHRERSFYAVGIWPILIGIQRRQNVS